MNDWLNLTFGGNNLSAYLTALIAFALGVLGAKAVEYVIFARLKRLADQTENTLDDFLVLNIERSAMPLLYYGIFYLVTRDLRLTESIQNVFRTFGIVLLTFFTTRFLIEFLTYLLNNAWKRGSSDTSQEQQTKVVLPILRFSLWGLAGVFLLDNLGFKVSSVIAGLGIGGIAVALAAQAVLGDLLSYVAIVFDKPFILGDFIILENGFMGSVEHIGIKTTHLRSLGGELIVIPNSDLTSHRVRNYKRMTERRVVFRLGLLYDTSSAKLEKVPAMVRQIIESQSDTRFDRCHFMEFGDFSLITEVVYYVLSPDYNRYMDLQQAINLGIKKAFEETGIGFAYPTQTLHVTKDPDTR